MGENIGAAARAMANFGFSELILVTPRDVWPNPKAWALASGATWPLENAKLVGDVAAAVSDKSLVIATTGTPRQLDKPLIGPRAAVARIRAAMKQGEAPVILFGSERAGLDNQHIINADILVTFPVDGRFPSLNLAQSVACLCYEWASFSEADGTPPGWTMTEKPAAPRQAFESFFDNLIEELDQSRFFWPDDRKATMVETLRNACVRGRFTMNEISLLRGAVRSLVEGPRRRALQSDQARAQILVTAWLASRNHDNDHGQSDLLTHDASIGAGPFGGAPVDFVYSPQSCVMLVALGDGRTGAWLIGLDEWRIASARYVGA
jgi:tRNA/rRNA methyltransferase